MAMIMIMSMSATIPPRMDTKYSAFPNRMIIAGVASMDTEEQEDDDFVVDLLQCTKPPLSN
jgi:hypothetical protein